MNIPPIERVGRLADFKKALAQALFAPRCLLCNASASLENNLCSSCFSELPQKPKSCLFCAKTLPLRQQSTTCLSCLEQPLADSAIAAFDYVSPINWLITELKFHKKRVHARTLAFLLAREIARSQKPLPEALVAVPLHTKRYRSRGYNQAQLIAQIVGQLLNIKLANNLVTRAFNTPAQLGLPAAARRRNVLGAFDSVLVPYKHVAIVDDVVTTGSTAHALASTLKDHGAKTVDLWCIARA